MTTLHSILQQHIDYTSFQSSRRHGDPLCRYIARDVACVKQNAKRRSVPERLTDEECYTQARVRLLAQPDRSQPPSAASSSSSSSSNSDVLLDVYAQTSTLLRVWQPPPPSSAVAATSPTQREAALRQVLVDCRTVRAAQVRRGQDPLAPSQWLDDNIISFGADSLNLEHGFSSNGTPSTHAFCFTSLEVSSERPLALSQTHKRYPTTARANELPHRWWLLPLHVHGNHWALAVYDRQQAILILLDSLNNQRATLAGMADTLKLLPKRLGHTEQTLRIVRQRVTQQTDGCSCGLFVLEFMRTICSMPSFDFDQFGTIDVDVSGTRARLAAMMATSE
jgi:hypothetical protein